MAYAGIQMFMEKLKQLINCTDHPSINNETIRSETPQFQLLFNDLDSMIKTLFIDEHQDLHDLEKVNDLKERFVYAAEEAQYIVDMFISGVDIKINDKVRRLFMSVVDWVLSCVHIRNDGPFSISRDFKRSLNLVNVRRSFESVMNEFMSMRNDKMEMNSSRRIEKTINQSVAAGSKKLLDEIVVGFDDDFKVIRDKLVEDQKKLDVVSIVGMGGIGKTTLATKVFNDGYVKHHFYVRVWVTVSQTYDKRHVLTQILESICGQSDLRDASDSRLRELVHKKLMGRRYLIVIDDIWDVETWDNLKLFFPRDNNASRILLTSRVVDVASHATSDGLGLIHHLGCLNNKRSWNLLCQKVFNGNECPKWSIKPGMQIVQNCKGLPLAVTVIAGVLAKESLSEEFWVDIAHKTGSYIVDDQNGCLEILGLSYNHLPMHLRECFLYLGGFPEDYMYLVKKLIWLWMAEGFIQQDGDKSLEEIAEGYLMDLIDRNLVIVEHVRKSNGDVKAFKVHDIVRELCLRKAKEEEFIIQTETLTSSAQSSGHVITQTYKPVRMFINKDSDLSNLSSQNLRSVLWVNAFGGVTLGNVEYLCSFVLLRVLDLRNWEMKNFPKGMELLVHLRYLAIYKASAGFPSSICNLWSLQTLIYITENGDDMTLPSNISDLTNLKHLVTSISFSIRRMGVRRMGVRKRYLEFPFIQKPMYSKMCLEFPFPEKPMNLQTLSTVRLDEGVRDFQEYFPYIKTLKCLVDLYNQLDFKSLIYLEKLKLTVGDFFNHWPTSCGKNHITFPTTLKTLHLVRCKLPWSDMSTIESLPNLQVLKLEHEAFVGSSWNTAEQEFRQLKFLRLEWLDIEVWEAYSASFPCLKQLEIISCRNLKEIPLEIGDVPTLELIKIKLCRCSLGESVRRIQEDQHDFGNYDLEIDISNELSDELIF